jgi:hypothetical protein
VRRGALRVLLSSPATQAAAEKKKSFSTLQPSPFVQKIPGGGGGGGVRRRSDGGRRQKERWWRRSGGVAAYRQVKRAQSHMFSVAGKPFVFETLSKASPPLPFLVYEMQ